MKGSLPVMNNKAFCQGSLFSNFLSTHTKAIAVIVCSFIISQSGLAQNSNAKDKEAAYIQTITQRSNKIVATLSITDSSKFYRVQNILVQQYSSINTLHEGYNVQVKTVKKDSTLDKKTASEKIAAVETERTLAVGQLHKTFLSKLTTELNDDQVTKIKDGMTYNKVAVTYNAYVAMIPSLTEEQKKKIYGYLVEAREYAMDAESADKKTEWFGKYKGRINNYLSAQGYDVKKEGQEWEKRIKEAKEKKDSAA